MRLFERRYRRNEERSCLHVMDRSAKARRYVRLHQFGIAHDDAAACRPFHQPGRTAMTTTGQNCDPVRAAGDRLDVGLRRNDNARRQTRCDRFDDPIGRDTLADDA